MWSFPQSSNDSYKSIGSLKFNVSMVFVNPKIKCFYLAKSPRYKNQLVVSN